MGIRYHCDGCGRPGHMGNPKEGSLAMQYYRIVNDGPGERTGHKSNAVMLCNPCRVERFDAFLKESQPIEVAEAQDTE